MWSPSLVAALALFLPAFSSAQSNYPNQSAPFNLVLKSPTNNTLNNAKLAACHTGAALESLCIDTTSGSGAGESFYYNTTDLTTPPTGVLTWTLVGANFVLNQPMDFVYDPTSNIALPLLQPSDQGQEVQFDAKTGEMGIAWTLDDTVTPPKALEAPYPIAYNWYVCQTDYLGYQYYTLAWKVGCPGEPQNPSCEAVKVYRLFTK